MKFARILFILGVLVAKLCFAEEVRLSDRSLDQFLGKEWKGILYVCDPYCRFVSIRESQTWNPVLNDEVVDARRIRGISEKDPAYPYLIVESPVFPFLSQRLKNSDLLKGKGDGSDIPPKYAQAPFNFAWLLSWGAQVSHASIVSNTSVQSELSPQGAYGGLLLEGALMKGSPNKLWKFWLQHEVRGTLQVGGQFQTVDGAPVMVSGMEVRYQAWVPQPTYKTGPRLSYFQESLKVNDEVISHYSMDQTSILLGWAFLWRRWELSLDTALSGTIHDTQNFRQGGFARQFYRVGVNYCSRDVSLFDIPFGLCGGAAHTIDQQSSSLAENVYVTHQSKLDISETSLKFMFRIGEDFYR